MAVAGFLLFLCIKWISGAGLCFRVSLYALVLILRGWHVLALSISLLYWGGYVY